jgi:hypothetical protein
MTQNNWCDIQLTFYNSSYNEGNILGTGIFYDNSINRGYVNSGLFYDNSRNKNS